MYVSLKWIEQMLGLRLLSLNRLTNTLILTGFEIESIKKKTVNGKIDIILDISITANRSDSTTMIGFLIELLALFNSKLVFYNPLKLTPLFFSSNFETKKIRVPFYWNKANNYKSLAETKTLSFYSNSRNLLFRYTLWEHYQQKKYFFQHDLPNGFLNNFNCTLPSLKGYSVKVTESPGWIKKRLDLLNFKPINNVIDIIHYILIETGQVFFAYDLFSFIPSGNFSTLKFNLNSFTLNTRFSISKVETIILPENILTLFFNQKPLSIFGVLQDFNTLVTESTSDFILQPTIVDPLEVKNSTKILGLKTEYSLKLEKQINLNLFEQAYLRLLYLFKTQKITFRNFNGSQFCSFLLPNKDVSFLSRYFTQSRSKIKIFYKTIRTIIGPSQSWTKFKNLEILNSLRVLNFQILYKTDNYFILEVPLQRKYDIEQEIDVIEEIVRILGFNSFPSILPTGNKLGRLTKFEKMKRRLRTSFINLGFHESLHSILAKKTSNYHIGLKNPLFNESCALRVSLLNVLLEKVFFNKKITRDSFETFELGRVYKFLQSNSSNKQELELLSGIFGGKLFRSLWDEQSSTINWFEAKGILENIFLKIAIPIKYVPIKMKKFTLFHPTRTANIFIGSQMVGTFGQVHPVLSFKGGLPKQLYLFEFNMGILEKFWRNKTSVIYFPYSSYPISYIDLSCITKKTIRFEEIERKIFEIGQPLLDSIELFDYYSKPPIKEGFCSLSFKLGFISKTRTLLNTEVNNIVETIISVLEKNFEIEFN